jgi:hypothetical protein
MASMARIGAKTPVIQHERAIAAHRSRNDLQAHLKCGTE